ncbi:SpvB/TcaC N-terminal domain-containing protein [Tahibacter soli]|uniref:FG-GAP-like repeat-containing protein n=1 Tax=Tahibacter soli TaxID=2983605 RepID=A0A9X4BHM2_9GAMM|nr:SpvB/TcaC N-terminal domain-containing protein [Tahibacter soli]MDC8012568.1 FG-GAP-like repeat-containing protein [Tahibacter soli]
MDRGIPLRDRLAVAWIVATLTLAAGVGVPIRGSYALDAPLGVLADLPPHDATVGTMAGEAMAEGGAASYTIPITLPPGRRGMQPSLSLSYSSRSGAGTAGLGWSLGGTSSIHRCPRTPEQDGEARAVRGDASDRLCLDGQRLIVVNPTTLVPIAGQAGYGANGAVYRTEIDSFARITQFGDTLGGAGSCFKVESKSGVVRYYGGTPIGISCSDGARVIPGGVTAPLSWMVKREVDSLGNTVTYTYASSDATGTYGVGEVLLQGVQYTGFGADPGDRSVTLLYEERPAIDRTSSYVAGGVTRQTRRLSAIGTHDGSQAVRSYALAYHASNYSGHSVLESVTECAYAPGSATPVCHSPTTFTYADSGEIRWPHEFKRLTIPGLTSAQLDQPDANSVVPAGHPTEPEGTVNVARPSYVRELGDFDGDGTRELGITHYNASGVPKQYLAAFTTDRQLRGIVDADTGLGVPGVLSAGTQLADVNGDGRTDLVGRRVVGGQRKIYVGVWTTTGATSWLPGNFTPYDLAVPLPSPTDAVGCEAVSFADMNGDGRADLLLEVPTSMTCGTASPPRELRIYLGQAGTDPLVPTFAATPSVTRALANVPGSGSTVHSEGISLMDFDGDGLPDALVSRPADETEQNRTLKVWFGRNTGGTYTLGGTGQEIASIAGLANPPLAADETHKQAYTVWADVNGDGLQDWISIAIGGDGIGYWAVRLNKGGVLGARMITTSRRGIERCVNDPQPNTTNNHCGVRWQPVFTALTRTADVDSDGRADLLVPRAFAARLCVRRVAAHPSKPGEEVYHYWCPENPQTGALDPAPGDLIVTPPNKYYGMYAPGGDATDGSQAGRFGGDFDPSAYFMDALRFVQTSETTFGIEATPTDIVRGQSSFDMYGDGLTDEIAYIGNAYKPVTTLPRYDAVALYGSGLGPDTLPDGTPVTDLEAQRYTYVSENVGVGRITPTLSGALPRPAAVEAIGDLPRLPELMTGATNGLGDTANWTHLPLGVGLSVPNFTVAGQPFYAIPAQRYTDARHYYFASSMPVVYALLRSNGIGGSSGARTQVFTYAEAMYNHQGRGFQGFRQIATYTATGDQAVDRELRTLTTFHQKFPLTGKAASVAVAPSSQPGFPISREANDWRCTLGASERQVCPGDGATPNSPQRDTVYFPYLDHQVATTYDLVQAEAGVSAAISEVDTLNAASSSATTSGWDAFGNLRHEVVTSRDLGGGAYPDGPFVAEHRRTTERAFTSSTSTWFLDQLDSETTTATITYSAGHTPPAGVAAPPRTLTTGYAWNADRTPSRQVVQFGIAGQEAKTAWCYRTANADCPSPPGGTNYGLPSSMVVSAPDAGTARRASYTYSRNGIAAADDGYFVLTTTNAVGHVVTTERRPRDGQVSRAIAPNLTSAVTTYDAFDRPVAVEARGTNSALIEPETRMALTRYAAGRCSTEVGTVGGGGEAYAAYCATTVKAGAPTTVTWNDRLGRPVKAAQRGFDGRFIVTKTEYDLMGAVHRQSMPRYADAVTDLWQERTYDRQGRLAVQIDPATDLAPGNGDRRTRMTYAGRRTTTRVQDNTLNPALPCAAGTACYETKAYTNVLGSVMYGVDAGNTATRSWVDPNGKPVGIQDNEGVLTIAVYDARGRRTQSVDPDQGTWSFVQNGLDELVSETDGRGAVMTVTQRDLAGRVRQTTRTPPPPPTPLPVGMTNETIVDEWAYDPANGPGQLASILRKRGTTIAGAVQVWKEQYGYETTTRRPSTITSTIDGEAGTWISAVTYDSNGREWTRSYPSGLTVETGYTAYGQVRQLNNRATGAIYWTATAADAWGKVTAETFGNGLTGTHTWAASTGQAKQLQWRNGPTTVERFDYAYDPLGNLKSQQRGGVTETYGYDARQRLTATTLSSGGGASFAYSASGNLTSKSDFSAGGNAYSYGGNGCGPHGVSGVAMPGGGTVTYACDANGNVIGGSALTASFDVENRPRTIARDASGSGGGGSDLIFKNGFEAGSSAPETLQGGPADGSMSYAYDAKGGRYVEIAAGGTTRYGPNGYEKVIAGTVTHRHELGPVIVSRVGTTDTVSYVLRDRLGSTIAVSDASMAVNERRQFDAFGKARNADFTNRPAGQANLTATNRGFTAHTQADDVWLVHMNGRVYDQNLGRFLSVDPIVQGGGSQALNPYSYIQNNPLSGTDPSGYAAAKDECAGSKAGGCTMPDQPAKLVKATSLTGSRIAGGGTGGSSFSYVEVNPSEGGQASLAVALAGSSSGYVMQASVIDSAAGAIAADNGKAGDRQAKAQDRPARGQMRNKPASDGAHDGMNLPVKKKISSNPDYVVAFFEDLYEPLKEMAKGLELEEDWMLALSSYESGWYNSHNRGLNNPFGLTKAGGANIKFSSPQAAINLWINTFGNQVRSAGSIDEFITNLLSPPRVYNTENKKWSSDVKGQVETIKLRKEIWLNGKKP